MGKVLFLEEGMELFAQGKALLSLCEVCKTEFYQLKGGTYASYCSASCRQKAFRARRKEEKAKLGRNAKEKA